MSDWSVSVPGGWLALALAASLLGAAGYPLLRLAIRDAAPAARSLLRLGYAGMAPLAATLAVALGAWPELGGLLVPAHCHGDHCGQHAPLHAVDSAALIGLSLVASLAAGGLLVSVAWALRRGRRRLRALQVFARRTPRGYRLLRSPQPIACCTGLWRPQVLLSTALVESLSARELQIVLAHENAHARRLDNLRALLLRWVTLAWPAPLARRLRADAGADAEQACDLAAVGAGFAPAEVGATIRRLARHAAAAPRGAAFNSDGTAQRLAGLEHPARMHAPRAWVVGGLCLAASWCVQVYLLTALYHGLIEWLGGAPA